MNKKLKIYMILQGQDWLLEEHNAIKILVNSFTMIEVIERDILFLMLNPYILM